MTTRYIMLGGFLGAGKTTAMLRLAEHLQQRGLRAGLITNDQGVGLVDTHRAQAAQQPVAEVTGGCFCCKFDTLLEAAEALTCSDDLDALIAEPVGSCTDIRATVAHPLRQLFGDRYLVAPLSVLVDPARCAEALGLIPAQLSTKIEYIYRKQLEEADLIVVNKIDTLDPTLRARLFNALSQDYLLATLLEVSCATGEGTAAWFDILLSGAVSSRAGMPLDYDTYAEGEALLGWLNARIAFTSAQPISGDDVLLNLLNRIKRELSTRGIEVAHAKASVETGDPVTFGSASLISTAGEPAITRSSEGQIASGILTLNLRAEADPDLLRTILLTTSFTMPGVSAHIEELAAFRPGRPTPTHRYTTARR